MNGNGERWARSHAGARGRARDRGGRAIAAARFSGRGNEKAADKAAVDAMRHELGRVSLRGTVVIGEGEMDEAPMLYIGEKVGNGTGPEVDIAVDPLEGTTICAKLMPNALAVLAIVGARRLPACARHVHEQDRHRSGLSGGRRRSRRVGGGQPRRARQGEGRADLRHHGLPARPAASRGADPRGARGGRRRAAHSGRRHRGRDLDDGPGRDRRSTSISDRAAPPRACSRRRRCAASAVRSRGG